MDRRHFIGAAALLLVLSPVKQAEGTEQSLAPHLASALRERTNWRGTWEGLTKAAVSICDANGKRVRPLSPFSRQVRLTLQCDYSTGIITRHANSVPQTRSLFRRLWQAVGVEAKRNSFLWPQYRGKFEQKEHEHDVTELGVTNSQDPPDPILRNAVQELYDRAFKAHPQIMAHHLKLPDAVAVQISRPTLFQYHGIIPGGTMAVNVRYVSKARVVEKRPRHNGFGVRDDARSAEDQDQSRRWILAGEDGLLFLVDFALLTPEN